MNASVTGGLLVEQPIERFRSFGAFGSPAWQGHVQLRTLVRQRLGEQHANVFAVPHYDPETALMRWTSAHRGAVRPWHELSADEQARYTQTLEGLRRDLETLAAKLRSQGEGRPGGSSGFASLLEQALKVPAEGRFLYLVGEQPVIAFWGFENARGGSVEGLASAPSLPSAAGVPPLPAASFSASPAPSAALPAAAAVPGHPLVPAAVPEAVVAPGVPVAGESDSRPWWRWLLIALALLLLLILLLFFLRSCLPVGSFGLGGGLPGVSMPGLPGGGGPGLPSAPSGPQPYAMDPTPPGASGGPPPATPAASGPTGPSAPGVVDPAQPAAPNSPPNSPNPPLPPAPPGPSTAMPPPPPPPSAQAPGRNPPPVPQDPKALQLPKDPRAAPGMDFLMGAWKAGEGLVDKNTKAPLDLSMKFGPDGRGEMTVRRPDGTACSGAVQGRMEGGRLTVEGNRSVPCVDGGSYGAPRIECGRTSTGETQCEGVNRDGSRYFVDMRRQ